MSALGHWRACDEISVIQSILLIVGADPAEWQDRVENLPPTQRPPGYDAVAQALTADILGGVIRPSFFAEFIEPRIQPTADGGQRIIRESRLNRFMTLLKIMDLEQWVRRKGIETDFFANRRSPGYLDPSHPQYSRKLAAAVHAWDAVVLNPTLRRGVSEGRVDQVVEAKRKVFEAD